MSELKAFESERIYWSVEQVEREAGDIDSLHLDDNLFYIKSEADRYISELKAEKAQAEDNAAFWKAKCEELRSHAFNASCQIIDGISEKNSEIEMLKQKLKDLQEYTTEEVNELCVEKENVWQIEKAWKVSQRSLFLSRYGIAIAWYAKWGRENPDKIFFMNGRTFGWLKEHWKKVGLYWKKKYDEACR